MLEHRTVKLVGPGFDRIVLRALPVKLYPCTAGLHLELLDGFDGDTEADRPALTLLDRIRDRDAFNEHILGKALRAIDCSPAITFRDSRQQENERARISGTLANAGTGDGSAHRQRQIRIQLVSYRD